MDLVLSSEPQLIPGYTGHSPEMQFRIGKSYGKLSHQLFLDPCIKHAPNPIITAPQPPVALSFPTKEELQILNKRVKFVDTIYQHPLTPGYEGFIPNITKKIGKCYSVSATAAIADHATLTERMRSERSFMKHQELLAGDKGLFETNLQERMMPRTKYRLPLIPVRKRAQAIKVEACNEDQNKMSYSKFTVPHFMEDENVEKYVVTGYSGHIPMTSKRFGQSNKPLTHNSLCEFTNNYYHRKSAEWCPMEMTGIASSCPNMGQFVIYHRTIGMIPKYGGHVPGEAYSFGKTYGNATVDAKYWLDLHKD